MTATIHQLHVRTPKHARTRESIPSPAILFPDTDPALASIQRWLGITDPAPSELAALATIRRAAHAAQAARGA
jgi:hypothetical protein